jgi:hypothetical protein
MLQATYSAAMISIGRALNTMEAKRSDRGPNGRGYDTGILSHELEMFIAPFGFGRIEGDSHSLGLGCRLIIISHVTSRQRSFEGTF